ncbi:uncharacterized protein LOC110974386 [Acanthaster planci]|uniref:Uncharacterized protein LOC110974386 n=1 Tax=Acanthaster planci TaxID=133434 RepID=A0A8B7XLI6_ACAPL|nr:uncharacterized protein LOC110974386 [Acanthaster planci]
MEEAEVIDIDDLLGSSAPIEQQDAEEYNFENFFTEGETPQDPNPTTLISMPPPPKNISTQGGHKQQTLASGSNQSKQGPWKASLEEDFKKFFLSSKSSKRKLKEPGNNNVTWEKDPGGKNHDNEDFSDAKVAQNEALLDALVQGELSDAVLSDEELCIDVNSEELRQFILEFETSGKGNGDKPHDVASPGKAKAKQGIVINHRHVQSEDQESLNSSISTTESRDGSLTSSLASSDLSPIRTKQKVPRGKSVRFLMSNLLRNNKAQHHPTNCASGSDEDSKETRRAPAKTKEKTKRRDKEEKERDRVTKQQAKIAKTQMYSAASTNKAAAHLAPLRQGDRAPDGGTQPLSQVPSVTVATPLSTETRDNTLHKQLIQAAARGDLQVLEFLLAANEGLSEVRDSRGNTLLHAVARRGHVDCLAWLAEGPCSEMLSVENDDCFTVAALAVKHGQVDCVKCLVQHSGAASELHPPDHRWSLLHLAARFGQEACLRWLLEYMQMEDISVDQRDHSNNSPAHLAAKYGYLQCLQTLVEFNSDVTLLNKKKQSPCTLATRYHHDTCAQFLVVVETCIKLSNELTLTQRRLRESQQEKEILAKKLREAMSCTDALVHMQKTDLSQQIEQIQGEYVDLTNLLVHQLDQMHRHQTDSGSQSASSFREELTVSKQKASQLEQACSELLEMDQEQQQDAANRNQLQEIERRLSRLQPLPTSPIWPTPPAELHPGLALDSMRARLSEVNQQISTLHHPSPSLASDNLDTLSLSSSYTSSLSSSSSSLPTGVVQSSPAHSAKKHKTSWNEELSPRGTLASKGKTDRTHRDLPKPHKAHSPTIRSTGPELSDPVRKAEGQRLNLPCSSDFGEKNDTSVQYVKRGLTGQSNETIQKSQPQQSQANILHVKASVEPLPQNKGHSSTSTVGKNLPKEFSSSEDDADKTSPSPPSYEESCSRQSRNLLRVESSIRAKDTTEILDPVLQNEDEDEHCPDQTGQTSSQRRTASSGTEEPGSPTQYLLPAFDRPQPISDNLHQISTRHYSMQQKYSQQAMPGFMRKVQPTNEFGEPESGKVIVKISNREELVLLPSQANKAQLPSAHQRLGSNSSVSSLSSDHPWSESDPDESPRPTRQPQRGGILSKKSQNKKSQDKHITFALDEELKLEPGTSSLNIKPPLNKRRDLSPIYEAPDLVKSTNDDPKSQQREPQKSDKLDESSGTPSVKKSSESSNPKDKSPIGGRNSRLFSYSSDEGDHEGLESHRPQKPSPRHEAQNQKYLKGLCIRYESSDSEDDAEDQHSNAGSSSGFERHICYL